MGQCSSSPREDPPPNVGSSRRRRSTNSTNSRFKRARQGSNTAQESSEMDSAMDPVMDPIMDPETDEQCLEQQVPLDYEAEHSEQEQLNSMVPNSSSVHQSRPPQNSEASISPPRGFTPNTRDDLYPVSSSSSFNNQGLTASSSRNSYAWFGSEEPTSNEQTPIPEDDAFPEPRFSSLHAGRNLDDDAIPVDNDDTLQPRNPAPHTGDPDSIARATASALAQSLSALSNFGDTLHERVRQHIENPFAPFTPSAVDRVRSLIRSPRTQTEDSAGYSGAQPDMFDAQPETTQPRTSIDSITSSNITDQNAQTTSNNSSAAAINFVDLEQDQQVSLLAQVLLTASVMTASHLVGEGFTRGRLYRGDIDAPSDDRETFPQFLDHLSTQRSNGELALSMFGSGTNNFFRFFTFPINNEGRVPILLIGVRASERRRRDDSGSDFIQENDNSLLGFSELANRTRPETENDMFQDAVEDFGEPAPLNSIPTISDISTGPSQAPSPSSFAPTASASFSTSASASANPEETGSADGAANETPLPRSAQFWVTFVIGGTYLPSHPVFSAPSLLTNNPAYEDLLLLEELLSSDKQPVATTADLDAAGGTFVIQEGSSLLEERCPVCLVDYGLEDECRRLVCSHVFHQVCVDQWLTRSHNSCPMCRHEGVQQQGRS